MGKKRGEKWEKSREDYEARGQVVAEDKRRKLTGKRDKMDRLVKVYDGGGSQDGGEGGR